MAVLRCSVCGGELELNADMSVGTCLYCRSVITVPKELDRKGHLYNRAVFLRQNNEFDKAELVYEDLLKEDNEDADAHWGLILSKFGIEYVKDPAMGEYFPTCHRTQTDPILSDPDYLAAVQYADTESKQIIKAEAEKIASIQRHVLEISAKEPPYDVFICYKESDAAGNRTQDSVLAQELYFELCKRNYRVFFARKTLESKLGTEYEPIIYAALNSAKVMVVLGTCAEHFNAVWVKNEWSRFLKMAAKKRGEKVVIPTYRDMSPYELPLELSNLQAQDMSKIGFMQDLTDGIDRVLHKSSPPNPTPSSTLNSTRDADVMVARADTFLRLGNFAKAIEKYQEVTNLFPDDYRGWWGAFVSRTENLTKYADPGMTMQYIKTLASSENYETCENKFRDWMRDVVVPLRLADEMDVVDKKITTLLLASDPFLKEISSIQRTKEKENQKYEQALRQKEKELDTAEKGRQATLKGEIASAKAKMAARRGWGTFFLILPIGGLIAAVATLVDSSGSGDFLLVLGLFVLFGLPLLMAVAIPSFLCFGTASDLDNVIQKKLSALDETIAILKKEVKTADEQYQHVLAEDISESVSILENARAEISKQNNDIINYQNFSEERLNNFKYRQLCERYHVLCDDEFDYEVEEKYQKMYETIHERETPFLFRCESCNTLSIVRVPLLQGKSAIQGVNCVSCGEACSLSELFAFLDEMEEMPSIR